MVLLMAIVPLFQCSWLLLASAIAFAVIVPPLSVTELESPG
jgi:hypothetical protein